MSRLRPLPDLLTTIVVANFTAAAVVGLLLFVVVTANLLGTSSGVQDGLAMMIGGAVFFGLMAAIMGSTTAFLFFLVGLTLIGVPTWWVLHRVRWEHTAAFVIVAAIESVLGGLIFAMVAAPGGEAFSLLLVLPGGMAGWTIRRLAYVQAPAGSQA